MKYIPNTRRDKVEMLEAIGVDAFEKLVSNIQTGLLLSTPLEIPAALSELELKRELQALSDGNADTSRHACFLGGGAYDHFIPSSLQDICKGVGRYL